jgi:pimeloyl-ACP methyl ester carboxylesterase
MNSTTSVPVGDTPADDGAAGHALVPCHVEGAELGYRDSGGEGEPLVLVHAGVFADWFIPLASAGALAGRRVIRVVRAGYTGTPAPAGLTIADHARHCAALLEQLHASPAHLVGHSSGVLLALEVALQRPDLVASLTLSEPPLVLDLVAPEDRDAVAAGLGPVVGAAVAAAARGDLATAADTFLGAVCGPRYRDVLTAVLGAEGTWRAEQGCGYFFSDEIPASHAWRFSPQDAARIRRPVLLVQGGASPPVVHRLVGRLAALLPTVTVETLESADHLLPLTEPDRLAALVSAFVDGVPGQGGCRCAERDRSACASHSARRRPYSA